MRTDTASLTQNPIVVGIDGGDILTLSDEQKWVGTVRGRFGVSPSYDEQLAVLRRPVVSRTAVLSIRLLKTATRAVAK